MKQLFFLKHGTAADESAGMRGEAQDQEEGDHRESQGGGGGYHTGRRRGGAEGQAVQPVEGLQQVLLRVYALGASERAEQAAEAQAASEVEADGGE